MDGVEQPIAFVSKSLNKAQLSWSVIQKEAYGNFFSCTYLQSLLRDRKFLIKTDHKNLLFISEHSNPMIVRWYMALQDFDFIIEFVAGVDNDIADAMSRLCRNNVSDSPLEYSSDVVYTATIRKKSDMEKSKITKEQYRKNGLMHNSKVGHLDLSEL